MEIKRGAEARESSHLGQIPNIPNLKMTKLQLHLGKKGENILFPNIEKTKMADDTRNH